MFSLNKRYQTLKKKELNKCEINLLVDTRDITFLIKFVCLVTLSMSMNF